MHFNIWTIGGLGRGGDARKSKKCQMNSTRSPLGVSLARRARERRCDADRITSTAEREVIVVVSSCCFMVSRTDILASWSLNASVLLL